jgi:hypothetical protein
MTATQVQARRDTATNLNAATPAAGEFGYDTTNKRAIVGDGSTLGGIKIPSAKDTQDNTFVYATVGGTGNAITLTVTPALTAYTAGQRIIFKATNDSSSAVTANTNSLGSRDVKFLYSGALTALDATNKIKSGGMYELFDDGTQYQIKGLEPPIPAASGLVYLGAQTASSSSTLDLTSLISSTYNDYVIKVDGLRPSSDGADILLRTSANNGSSYNSGSNDYFWVGTMLTAPSTTAVQGDNADTSIKIAIGVSNDTNMGGVCGEIRLYNLNASVLQGIHYEMDYMNGTAGNTFRNFSGKGRRFAGTPVPLDAIRILPSTGNLATGTIRLYGVSKS